MSAVEISKPSFRASLEQSTIFDWVVYGTGNAILSAVAGSGKTTTLIQAMSLMSKRIFFGAYNRTIAKEIKDRLSARGLMRQGVDVSTMHSIAVKAWKAVYPKVEIDEAKVGNLIKLAVLKNANLKKFGDQAAFVKKLVSFGKSHLMGIKHPTNRSRDIDNMVVWQKLMEHYSLDESLPLTETHPITKQEIPFDVAGLLNFTVEIYKASIAQCKTLIDYDDMIFAPLYFNAKFYPYDWVIIDECQDINPARRELARRLLKKDGRFVGCGDERQSIYAFTGAGSNSIPLLMKEFNAAHYTLSTTYRCAKAIVAYVQQWVPHIKAVDTAAEGLVRNINEDTKEKPWFIADAIGANDAVLCRYTAPLVKNAFELLRKGIPCKVEGRDIGKNLINVINRWSTVKTLGGLETKLKKYLETETLKAEEAESDSRKQAAQDMFDTIMIFVDKTRANGQNTIDALVAEIESLFDDEVTGITTFSTGHKSKGREWKKVYWLETSIRSRRELKEWELIQEENINYVMGTRAMNELVVVAEYVHSPKEEK